MWLDWQSKSGRSCGKRELIRTTIISSCEEERAAYLAAEEERVGLLEVLEEDLGFVLLKIGHTVLYRECEYRHKCDFEISWMCGRTAEIVAREKSRR
jgi:hypothetical protein